MCEYFIEGESIELIHEILSVGEVELVCKLCLKIGRKGHVFQCLVSTGDRVVDQRDDLIESFVLMLFHPRYIHPYLNSGIFPLLPELAPVVFFRACWPSDGFSVGDLTGTGRMWF